MPAPLSNDLRERIIRAYKGGKPVKEIATQFYVGQDAVYKLIKHVNETGSINPKPLNNGRKPTLSAAQMDEVKAKIINDPNITLLTLVNELDLPIGVSALCKIINSKLNLKLKRKKTYMTKERGNANELHKPRTS